MTDRIDALRALKAKVEAGDATWSAHHCRVAFGAHVLVNLHKAFHGSLDAARKLHEAVLPGWQYWCEAGGTDREMWGVYRECCNEPFTGDIGMSERPSNPARMWLLAIINCLIAIEEQSQ